MVRLHIFPIFSFLAKMLSSLFRNDNTFPRNENIGKICKRTITWMDFSSRTQNIIMIKVIFWRKNIISKWILTGQNHIESESRTLGRNKLGKLIKKEEYLNTSILEYIPMCSSSMPVATLSWCKEDRSFKIEIETRNRAVFSLASAFKNLVKTHRPSAFCWRTGKQEQSSR